MALVDAGRGAPEGHAGATWESGYVTRSGMGRQLLGPSDGGPTPGLAPEETGGEIPASPADQRST